MTKELIQQGVRQPISSDFNDQLMGKIMNAPLPVAYDVIQSKSRKGRMYLILALVLMLFSITLISSLAGGYGQELSGLLAVTKSYILYGGMVLCVPVLFIQLDVLIKDRFRKQSSYSVSI